MITFDEIVSDITESLVALDESKIPWDKYQPGIGPYSETALVRHIADYFRECFPKYSEVMTKRTPDLLVPNEWALEFKLARPYGDNGQIAENWSVNLLHPYPGSTSSLGDCIKLLNSKLVEKPAIIVIGYEHNPAKIDLTPLIEAFEILAKQAMDIELSSRVETKKTGLVHPVHQVLRVFGWEVKGFLK